MKNETKKKKNERPRWPDKKELHDKNYHAFLSKIESAGSNLMRFSFFLSECTFWFDLVVLFASSLLCLTLNVACCSSRIHVFRHRQEYIWQNCIFIFQEEKTHQEYTWEYCILFFQRPHLYLLVFCSYKYSLFPIPYKYFLHITLTQVRNTITTRPNMYS